jgi:DNA-binding NarL/FixJ family response regulator
MSAAPQPVPHRTVLVCLTPPPSLRLAARLLNAGPRGAVRVAATQQQLASAAAVGWPDAVVTDTVTARGMANLLLRLRRGTDIVRVTTTRTDTLRAVIAGLTAGPPAVPVIRRPAALTHRQLEVLDLLCDGLANHQIAERLDIGIDTVKTHLLNARLALDATSRSHLAALAVSRGIVAPRR